MGRLFQYNRFGGNEDSSPTASRRNTHTRTTTKDNETCTVPKNRACEQHSFQDHRTRSAPIPTPAATDTTTTATAAKSVESAYKKYTQWSSKLLAPSQTRTTTMSATATASLESAAARRQIATISTATAPRTEIGVSQLSSAASLASSSALSVSLTWSLSSAGTRQATETTTATRTTITTTRPIRNASCRHSDGSGCGSDIGDDADDSRENDREVLVTNTTTVKRTKVYDCMKEFLRRKLFQASASALDAPKMAKEAMVSALTTLEQGPAKEDVTSDYDEIDLLDSSYNADEEDTTDCCSDYSCPTDSHSDEDEFMTAVVSAVACENRPTTSSPRKSILSLNCCQKSMNTDSTADEEDNDEQQQQHDESDAGISDCCQLIKEKNPKRKICKKSFRQRQPRKTCYSTTDDEIPELLESSWFQPRITTKHVLERLQNAEPGSFIVRRKSRTYELCLRVDTKIKQFTVVPTADTNYKLKGAKKQFPSLKALVTHHSVMAEQLPITLILPRPNRKCTQAAIRYADDFDTFESLQILGILKSLQAKNLDFL